MDWVVVTKDGFGAGAAFFISNTNITDGLSPQVVIVSQNRYPLTTGNSEKQAVSYLLV